MSLCDPVSGYLMDEATATFFYGPGGLQRVQQLVTPCATTEHERFPTPVLPTALTHSKKLPLLSELILAATTTTVPVRPTTQPVPVPVGVLAGGAPAKSPFRAARVAEVFRRITKKQETQLEQVKENVGPAEAKYITRCVQDATMALESIQWDWATLMAHKVVLLDVTVIDLVSRVPGLERVINQMHLLTTVIIQVVNKHVVYEQQGLVPKDNSYDAHIPVIYSFFHNELYNWWKAVRPKTNEEIIKSGATLEKATRAVLNKQDNVLRAAFRLNAILDDPNKWETPRNMFQRVARMVYNRARVAFWNSIAVIGYRILQYFGTTYGLDNMVESYLGGLPDQLLGSVAQFLKEYAPPLHAQFVNLFNPDIPVERDITDEHFLQYMRTCLIIYVAEYMVKSLKLPTYYIGVAIAFNLVAVEAVERVLQFSGRQLVRFLMYIARLIGLTRFVPEFDRRMAANGVMHVDQFKYTCDVGECKLVSVYFLRKNEVTYDTKAECLQTCGYIDVD